MTEALSIDSFFGAHVQNTESTEEDGAHGGSDFLIGRARQAFSVRNFGHFEDLVTRNKKCSKSIVSSQQAID